MASLTLVASCLLLTFALLALSTAQTTVVGGRTEIKDVGTNKEVQSLGRFAVEEYDRRLKLQGHAGNARNMVSFARVVEAQRQIIEGLKYFLKVAVKDYNGEEKMFDAVVVTKPWIKARELLSFTPNY